MTLVKVAGYGRLSEAELILRTESRCFAGANRCRVDDARHRPPVAGRGAAGSEGFDRDAPPDAAITIFTISLVALLVLVHVPVSGAGDTTAAGAAPAPATCEGALN